MSRIKNDPLNWINKDQEEEKKGPGRPRKHPLREKGKTQKENLPDDWTRATFIVREDLLETLKDLAYTNRTTIKEEINQALAEYLKDKEVIRRGDK